MSTKKIVRGIDESLDKAVSEIKTPLPEMKDDTIAKATAPKNDLTFKEAFKANRMAGNKTFTWGGKSYTTNVAGETKKPAAAAPTKPAASTPTTNTRASTELARTAARSQAAIREKRAENQADFRKRMQVGRSGVATAGISASRPKDKVRTGADMLSDFFKGQREREKEIGRQASKPKDYAAERAKMKAQRLAEKAERRKELGIREPGKAKGGSIDGCAIRGKTRAPTRKGK